MPAAILLAFVVFSNSQTAFGKILQIEIIESKVFLAEKFHRTELYFGTGKKDGSVVSDDEWNTK